MLLFFWARVLNRLLLRCIIFWFVGNAFAVQVSIMAVGTDTHERTIALVSHFNATCILIIVHVLH
ncbi:uncharacterized protein V1513DRAFT_59311 [Lipomyces chichibuensis]|uniref:uncharacterized protein n=1 Tax=Lipomyces chichibuensis TaxID=1546026 RepID=UPI003343E38A